MTPKLPAVTAKELVRVAERLGSYSEDSEAATPFTFGQNDHARVVIPMHAGELKRKTLRAIIQDLKITVEEFQRML